MRDSNQGLLSEVGALDRSATTVSFNATTENRCQQNFKDFVVLMFDEKSLKKKYY